MIDPKLPIRVELRGRVYNITRPTVLQFDVNRVLTLQGLVHKYAKQYRETEQQVARVENATELIDELVDCVTLVEKLLRETYRRVCFWLDAVSATCEDAVALRKGMQEADLDIVFPQIELQLIGGETIIKN